MISHGIQHPVTHGRNSRTILDHVTPPNTDRDAHALNARALVAYAPMHTPSCIRPDAYAHTACTPTHLYTCIFEYVRPPRRRHERVSLGHLQVCHLLQSIDSDYREYRVAAIWDQNSTCLDPGIFGNVYLLAHPQAVQQSSPFCLWLQNFEVVTWLALIGIG
jgi:hypothetical protein